MKKFTKLLSLAGCVVMASCDKLDDFIGHPTDEGDGHETGTIFENKSELDPLVSIQSQFNYVSAYSLLSSTDILDDGFQLVGAQDGAGFLKEGDGYMYVVNAEDNYAISRIHLDKNLNPMGGEWLLNSGVADFARQCSGTMWEKDIHGGAKDLFLSASESFNYDVKGIDPYIATPQPTADYGLDALGEFAWENAVPLPKGAYSGKTVIIGGDDDSSGSEGQVTLYYSENGDADLNNGKIYVLRLKQIASGETDESGKPINPITCEEGVIHNEGDLAFGETYNVEFVEIENGSELTVDEMETACVEAGASAFMRVEDVDYQKGSDANSRNIFFAVTGRGPGAGTYNDWGTAYRLELSEESPLEGKLTQIVSGNTDTNNMDGNLPELQSPDNITVTENFVYLQEDPNSFDRGHAAAIYQSDLNGHNIKTVLELVIRNDLAPSGSTGFSGEFGALVDISDKIGIDDTFLLNLQPHYWESEDFKNVDGHDMESRPDAIAAGAREDNQGGQIVILKGLPR